MEMDKCILRKKNFINSDELYNKIKNYKKVLILSPRKTGKTQFIVDWFEPSKNIIYYTMGSRYRDNLIDRLSKKYNINKTNINVYKCDVYFRESYEKIIIDEITYMDEYFINIMLKQDCNIICMDSFRKDDYDYDIFTKNNFVIIYAPLIQIDEEVISLKCIKNK